MRYIVVTITVRPEEDAFVAKCLELGTVSEGDTEEEALENIQEATLLFLNALEERGECKRVLAGKGVALHETPGSTIERRMPRPKPRESVHPAVFHLPCAV